MLNIDETLSLNVFYVIQRDFYLKAFFYSIGVIVFVDILRGQVAEVNLLQLIPGFYLILLFSSFLLLIFLSDNLVRLPIQLDNRKEYGTKTATKMEFFILLKISLSVLFLILLLVLNTVIPLSLDSFNSYGEKTLENIWSFDEVLGLEIILLFFLIILSQVPIGISFILNTEIDSQILPEFWKNLSLIIFLISGLLTPTIDGYTQLSFAFSTLSLYVFLINLIQKRVIIKYQGVVSLNF
jgi:hypothetical protein